MVANAIERAINRKKARLIYLIKRAFLVAGAGFVQDPTMLELRKAV
jgi:hypothetical protein